MGGGGGVERTPLNLLLDPPLVHAILRRQISSTCEVPFRSSQFERVINFLSMPCTPTNVSADLGPVIAHNEFTTLYSPLPVALSTVVAELIPVVL